MNEFDRRLEAFMRATEYYSGFDYRQDPVAQKAYDDLMALGPEIVMPRALTVLHAYHSMHLMNFLADLTQTNPVKPENRGYTRKMVLDWLDWAERRGIEFQKAEVPHSLWDNIPVATTEYP